VVCRDIYWQPACKIDGSHVFFFCGQDAVSLKSKGQKTWKINMEPKNEGGWRIILSFSTGLFLGEPAVNFSRVYPCHQVVRSNAMCAAIDSVQLKAEVPLDTTWDGWMDGWMV